MVIKGSSSLLVDVFLEQKEKKTPQNYPFLLPRGMAAFHARGDSVYLKVICFSWSIRKSQCRI